MIEISKNKFRVKCPRNLDYSAAKKRCESLMITGGILPHEMLFDYNHKEGIGQFQRKPN